MRGSLFYQDAFIEGRNEGREEGREEGKKERSLEILKKMVEQGMEENVILSLGFTKEDVEKMI